MSGSQSDKPVAELTERAKELIDKIKPILKDDEFCAVMTNDFNTFVMMPDDVQKRIENSTTSPADTMASLILMWRFTGILLQYHGISVENYIHHMVKTQGLTIVGADGLPIEPGN